MKSPAGYDQPRRKAAPGGKQVRLDLRPTKRKPSPEEIIERGQQSHFWKWFTIVALFHLCLVIGLLLLYRAKSAPPPEPFISLMPEGDTVKGTPGVEAAPKVGATTPAPSVAHASPPAPPQPVTPPPEPAALPPPPPTAAVLKPDGLKPAHLKHKLAKKSPPKPKVKVDLNLVERDVAAADATTPPPKPHVKHKKAAPKPVLGDDADIARAEADPDNRGLSREEIAAKLGAKFGAEGTTHATNLGASGAPGSHASEFADFYASIHDQVMDKWQEPNQDDAQATNPVVQIHVESDGRVPPESVSLLQSSGNQAIDDSALAAARSIGYTLQPLPDGCPPDISINFQLNH